MANTQFTIIISMLLLPMAFTSAIYGDGPVKIAEKHIEVVVEGMVYCQSCKHHGLWSLTDAKPIPKAKVSVICKDHRNRVSYYKACETDKKGYFYAQLSGFKMGSHFLDHPLQACHVKLVSSPLENCNLLANVNYGLNGSPLRYETKRLAGTSYEAVIYAAGPLAFHPAHALPPNFCHFATSIP